MITLMYLSEYDSDHGKYCSRGKYNLFSLGIVYTYKDIKDCILQPMITISYSLFPGF